MPRAAAADRHGAMNDEAVYEAVEPGVVDVTANLQYLQETAKGTGFVIDAAAGLILTNNHVIDGATSVTVTPVTSGRSYPARIVGYDRADDVALLQVQGVARLRAVTIGRSSQVQVGTPVLAIGNEGGQGGSPTVAPGVISSLGRTIVATDQNSGLKRDAARHDADQRRDRRATPGGRWPTPWRRGDRDRHGGRRQYRLLRLRHPHRPGHAHRQADRGGPAGTRIEIGLPAFLGVLLPDSISTSPQRQARQELHQTRAVSGSGRACTQRRHHIGPGQHRPGRNRALVDGVLCGTLAAQAGLFAGDVITSVGGHAVTSPRSLTALLGRCLRGSQVALAWVAPGGSLHTAVVTLAAGPAG